MSATDASAASRVVATTFASVVPAARMNSTGVSAFFFDRSNASASRRNRRPTARPLPPPPPASRSLRVRRGCRACATPDRPPRPPRTPQPPWRTRRDRRRIPPRHDDRRPPATAHGARDRVRRDCPMRGGIDRDASMECDRDRGHSLRDRWPVQRRPTWRASSIPPGPAPCRPPPASRSYPPPFARDQHHAEIGAAAVVAVHQRNDALVFHGAALDIDGA